MLQFGDTLDVASGNDRRKQLLQAVLQRVAAQNASESAGGMSLGGGSGLGMTPMRPWTRPAFAPLTHLTFDSGISQHLQQLLGPGGFGLPGAFEHGAGSGLPVPQLPVGSRRPLPVGAPALPAAPPPQAAAPPGALAVAVNNGQLAPLGGGSYFNVATGKVQGGSLPQLGSAVQQASPSPFFRRNWLGGIAVMAPTPIPSLPHNWAGA